MAHPSLNRIHLGAGAELGTLNGRPEILNFRNVRREIRAIRSGAGILDRSHWIRIEARGRDRVRFLNGMLSNEVARLEVGSGSYSLLLTIQGKVVADVTVYAFVDYLLLLLHPGAHEPAMASLEKYLIADKVSWHDVSERDGLISIQGPFAGEALQRVIPGLTLPVRPHDHVQVPMGDGQALITHEDRLGVGGYELHLPLIHYEPMWCALVAAGAIPVGEQAFDIVRVEEGRPSVGQDVGLTTLPLEAGAAFEREAISYEKGCYLGQEVVCRVKSRGQVNWMLTALKLTPEAKTGQRLFAGEKDVGWITSSVESPEQGWIGLGYVHRTARKLGQTLSVGQPDAAVMVTLLEVDSSARPTRPEEAV